MKPRNIDITFSIFDTGRKYTGTQRGYLLDNATEVINSPTVQERLKLRQLQGYFGHTMRELAGKMNLSAKNVLKLPNGQQIVADAIPGVVCTSLSIDKKGMVSHTQEVLDNDEGDKIWSLHKSKIGGFSWAATGGSSGGRTVLDDFFGFDYVPDPLNTNNKGWVMDSDSSEIDLIPERNDIIKGLKSEGIDKPGTVLDSWYASLSLANRGYQSRSQSQDLQIFDLKEENAGLHRQVNDSQNENALLNEEFQQYKATADEERKRETGSHEGLIDDLRKKVKSIPLDGKRRMKQALESFSMVSTVSIPDAVLDCIVNMGEDDTDTRVFNDFLQGVAGIKGGVLPLGVSKPQYVKRREFPEDNGDGPDLGSIGIVPEMKM